MPSRWESVVDAQIRMAQERGDFDDLPGKGKPIPGLGDPDDDLWWVKGFVRREGLPTDVLLPTSLRLRKEIEQLSETVRRLPGEQAVRDVVTGLNAQISAWIRTPSGPQVWIQPVDVEGVLREWRARRQEADERPPAGSAAGKPERQAPRRSWWRRVARRDRP